MHRTHLAARARSRHPPRFPLLSTITAMFLAAPITAQNLLTYDAGVGGVIPPNFVETTAVSALYPPFGPNPVMAAFPQLPPLPFPVPGPLPVPPGGVTIDGTNGQIWASEGTLIATTQHIAYFGPPPIVPNPAPVPPLAALPTPPGAPPWNGILYGMALDPMGPRPVLWMTDGLWIIGVTPAPPFLGVVFPAFNLLQTFPMMGPISGLEWDPITGSLWAVDVGGLAVNCLPGGAPGPGYPGLGVILGPAPLPATGISIDKTGGTGNPAFPRHGLYAVGPGMIFDYVSASLMPTMTPGGLELGLTFHPAPSQDPPALAPCPGLPTLAYALRGPNSTTNNSFGVDVTGLPPNTLVVYVFDFNLAPKPFGMINALGCPVGFIMPPPPLLSVQVVLANAAGVASFPIDLTLPFLMPGNWLFQQMAVQCPADPVLGFVLSPFYQVILAAP